MNKNDKKGINWIALMSEGTYEESIKAFVYFFKRYYPGALLKAHHLLQDLSGAEDMTQAAFVEMWRRKSFSSKKELKQFIYRRLIKFCRIRRHRLGKNWKQLPGMNSNTGLPAFMHELDKVPHAKEIYMELLKENIQTITAISPENQQALHDIFGEGKTETEIAAKMGISKNALRSRKTRAIRSLIVPREEGWCNGLVLLPAVTLLSFLLFVIYK